MIIDTSTGVVELADGGLVGRTTVGDQAAWEQLIQRHTGLLWAIARSFRLGEADSADVVQTCWLQLAEHLGRIRTPASHWMTSPISASRRFCAAGVRHRHLNMSLAP